MLFQAGSVLVLVLNMVVVTLEADWPNCLFSVSVCALSCEVTPFLGLILRGNQQENSFFLCWRVGGRGPPIATSPWPKIKSSKCFQCFATGNQRLRVEQLVGRSRD